MWWTKNKYDLQSSPVASLMMSLSSWKSSFISNWWRASTVIIYSLRDIRCIKKPVQLKVQPLCRQQMWIWLMIQWTCLKNLFANFVEAFQLLQKIETWKPLVVNVMTNLYKNNTNNKNNRDRYYVMTRFRFKNPGTENPYHSVHTLGYQFPHQKHHPLFLAKAPAGPPAKSDPYFSFPWPPSLKILKSDFCVNSKNIFLSLTPSYLSKVIKFLVKMSVLILSYDGEKHFCL